MKRTIIFSFAFLLTIIAAVADNPIVLNVGSPGGELTFKVEAPDGVPWKAESEVDWLTITEPSSGYGAGIVTYTVSSHGGVEEREGAIKVTISEGSDFDIVGGAFSWHTALLDADLRGGQLAVLDTQAKIDNANALIANYDGPVTKVGDAAHVWIGLTDRENESEWKWITGGALDVDDWASNQPNDDGSDGLGAQDYAVLVGPRFEGDENAGWYDDKRTNRYSYLIEYTSGNSHFRIVTEQRVTWQTALLDAQSRGGRLAVLDDVSEVIAVHELMENTLHMQPGALNVWIGLTDRENESEWKWITGETLGVSNWSTHEPNHNGDYAVIVGPGEGDHQEGWHDDDGGNEYFYLLETGYTVTEVFYHRILQSALPDSDNDGVADAADAFPNDPTETADTDGDRVGNNADVFPNDPTEWADTDSDGVGNNADVFPNDPTETADTDGDRVGNNADVFPNDPTEWADCDNDGVGDNADARSGEQIAQLQAQIAHLQEQLSQRPTLEELVDARVGSIVVEKDWQSGQVSLSLGLEKTEDGVTWTAYEGGTWTETDGGKFTLSFPLTETKNWVRLALKE
jgi:hypothetical protein